MFKEFKEFAMKGNVLDMAVGIIIGAAFGRIITSLVSDVIMPPLGLLLGKVDFSSLFLNIRERLRHAGAGKSRERRDHKLRHVLNTVLDFVIVAFVIFILIRRSIA